jgi:hypothetical protein
MLNDLTDLRKLNPKLTLRKARTYPNLLCKWSLSKAQKMVEVEIRMMVEMKRAQLCILSPKEFKGYSFQKVKHCVLTLESTSHNCMW